MQGKRIAQTIYLLTLCLLTICLTSLLVCLGAHAAPVIKPQKAALTPKAEIQSEQDANIVDHPAAWSDAVPYYNLANKYLAKERYEDAVDNYHEAIARFPNDPDFYINLGYCYRKLEDFESAEQAFRKALTLNNKDWITWSNLANALLKQNKLSETVGTFEKCLKLTMPASERAAINRDITDIKKILAMRQPKSAAKSETSPGKGALSKAALSQSAVGKQGITSSKPSSPIKKSAAEPALLQPKDKTKTESSGWDYVYK